MKRFFSLALLLLGITGTANAAGVITYSAPFTTDASTGISTLNTYTHKVGGGATATVNGVTFDALTNSITPANFTWNSSASKDFITNNNNNWVPATGGVTGTGIIDLLNDFTYSGSGASPGQSQSFVLSGLTPGVKYDARVYVRAWDVNYTGRLIGLSFTNGSDVDTLLAQTGAVLNEDQPVAQGYLNNNQAYFINYSYVAQATSMTITAPVATGGGGSFHMYAITNQVTPEPGSIAIWTLLAGSALGIGIIRRRRAVARRLVTT